MAPGLPNRSKEPQAQHSATVIWLHGLGDTGEGWMDVGPQLQMKLPFAAWPWGHGAMGCHGVPGGARLDPR